MISLFLSFLLFTGPGCDKDTDCKGDRICDSVDRVCADPPTPTPEQVELAEIFEEPLESEAQPIPAPAVPQAREKEYVPRYRTETARPYLGGGIACVVIGTLGVGAGTGIILNYQNNLQELDPGSDLEALREYADLVGKAPKVHAGSAILISSGITLFITGVVLTAITKQEQIRVGQNGILFQF